MSEHDLEALQEKYNPKLQELETLRAELAELNAEIRKKTAQEAKEIKQKLEQLKGVVGGMSPDD